MNFDDVHNSLCENPFDRVISRHSQNEQATEEVQQLLADVDIAHSCAQHYVGLVKDDLEACDSFRAVYYDNRNEEKALKESGRSLARLKGSVSNLAKQFRDAQDKVTSVTTVDKTELALVSSQLDVKRAELATKNAAAQRDLQTKQQRLDDLNRKLAAIRCAKANADQRMEVRKAMHSQESERLNGYRNRVAELKQALANETARRADLARDTRIAEERTAQLNLRRNEVEELLRASVSRREILTSERDTLRQQVSQTRGQRTALEKELELFTTRNDPVHTREEQACHDKLADSVTDGSIAEVDFEHDILQQKCDGLQQQLQKVRQDLAIRRREVFDAQVRVQRMYEDERARLSSQMVSMSQRESAASEELMRLRLAEQQLSELRRRSEDEPRQSSEGRHEICDLPTTPPALADVVESAAESAATNVDLDINDVVPETPTILEPIPAVHDDVISGSPTAGPAFQVAEVLQDVNNNGVPAIISDVPEQPPPTTEQHAKKKATTMDPEEEMRRKREERRRADELERLVVERFPQHEAPDMPMAPIQEESSRRRNRKPRQVAVRAEPICLRPKRNKPPQIEVKEKRSRKPALADAAPMQPPQEVDEVCEATLPHRSALVMSFAAGSRRVPVWRQESIFQLSQLDEGNVGKRHRPARLTVTQPALSPDRPHPADEAGPSTVVQAKIVNFLNGSFVNDEEAEQSFCWDK